MPYRVAFSSAEAFAVVTLSDTATWNDVSAALCALLGHPGWLPAFSVLWDTTAVTAVEASPADLPGARGLMEALADARAGGRSAVVVRPDAEAGLRIGAIATLLAGLGSQTLREVRTFTRMEDALRFLGRRTIPEGLPVIAASTTYAH